MTTNDPTNDEILHVLFGDMPDNERAILCSVAGDPSTVERWPGIPFRSGSRCPLLPDRNNYVTVSAFTMNEQRQYRRRKDQFAGLYAIMIDDIGTKIEKSSLPDILRPTLIVETSPQNFQAVFRLSTPVRVLEHADALIRTLINVLAPGGIDPGMAGVTRVMRLPGGINGKPKYMRDGVIWRCQVRRWSPETSMTFEELSDAFQLVKKVKHYVDPNDGVTLERKRGFQITLAGLTALGRVKRSGRWVDIKCPWVLEHTDRADTGAAVAYPELANGWMGGFRCHHGHCQNRGWGDLEDWVVESLIAEGRATRGPFKGPND